MEVTNTFQCCDFDCWGFSLLGIIKSAKKKKSANINILSKIMVLFMKLLLIYVLSMCEYIIKNAEKFTQLLFVLQGLVNTLVI